MIPHIVFVRFYLGYSESFPFEQVNRSTDEETNSAMATFCKDWWENRSNRLAFQKWRSESDKERAAAIERWNRGALAMPGKNLIPLKSDRPKQSPRKKPIQTGPNQLPCFEELTAFTNWRSTWSIHDPPPYGISRRYPLASFRKKDSAEVAIAALLDRVKELSHAVSAKPRSEGFDELLAHANPCFYVVDAGVLSAAESVVVMEKIQRLWTPLGSHPSREESLVRIYLPHVGKVLEQVYQMVLEPDGVSDKVHAASKMSTAPAKPVKERDGAIVEGKIHLDGIWYKLTPDLRTMLSFILSQPKLKVTQVCTELSMTDRMHFDKRLNDLRSRLRDEMKSSPRILSIKLDGEGWVSWVWTERK